MRSKQDENFQPALREGADAIAAAIRSSIMFCRTQAKLPKLDFTRVYLSGGGARLMVTVRAGAASDAGRVRQLNEDRAVTGTGRMFAVADGMGGHAAGEVASALTVARLARFLSRGTLLWWRS